MKIIETEIQQEASTAHIPTPELVKQVSDVIAAPSTLQASTTAGGDNGALVVATLPRPGVEAGSQPTQNNTKHYYMPVMDPFPIDVMEHLEKGCPTTGNGVHRWLYRTACILHQYCEPNEIVGILRKATAGCGRSISSREITDAVVNSGKAADNQAANPDFATPVWPLLDVAARADAIKGMGGVAELKSRSPVQLHRYLSHAPKVIDELFPGDPLLCMGWRKNQVETRPKHEWLRKVSRCEFMVPSPMTSVTGYTQNGKQSMRTLSNTGPRLYLVIEFDNGILDEQAALLTHLGQLEKLALVVFSGNKSLHGWYYVANRDDASLRPFMEYAVKLGADRATWTRVQLVRVPGGLRQNAIRQNIFYYDPVEVLP